MSYALQHVTGQDNETLSNSPRHMLKERPDISHRPAMEAPVEVDSGRHSFKRAPGVG
jgi:hypothetical protein